PTTLGCPGPQPPPALCPHAGMQNPPAPQPVPAKQRQPDGQSAEEEHAQMSAQNTLAQQPHRPSVSALHTHVPSTSPKRFTAQIVKPEHGPHRAGKPAMAFAPKLLMIGADQAIAAPAPILFSNVRREMPLSLSTSVSTESIFTPFPVAQLEPLGPSVTGSQARWHPPNAGEMPCASGEFPT